MKSSIAKLVVLSLTILTGAALAQAPARDRIIKGPSAAPKAPTDATVLANVQIAKTPDGKWKCQGAGGKPCTADERQATMTVTKSLSNIKNNLSVAPDGTVQCTTSDKKPCPDSAFQEYSTQFKKAITKGGQQGF